MGSEMCIRDSLEADPVRVVGDVVEGRRRRVIQVEGALPRAEPVLAPDPAFASSQRQSGNPRLRDDATWHDEAEGLRLAVHIAPYGAALDSSRPRFRVDVNAVVVSPTPTCSLSVPVLVLKLNADSC